MSDMCKQVSLGSLSMTLKNPSD